LFKKKGDKVIPELKPDEVDEFVEESLELMAGIKEATSFYPGIDIRRLSAPEEEPPLGIEEVTDEYEQVTYDSFDKFIRQKFSNEMNKYQSLDDLDGATYEAAERDLDALYN
jgi:hypothetical protein